MLAIELGINIENNELYEFLIHVSLVRAYIGESKLARTNVTYGSDLLIRSCKVLATNRTFRIVNFGLFC